MTNVVKTRVVLVALALLTVWPAVHIYLVKAYGLNPWKLGGWGMYSAPRSAKVGMEIFTRADGRSDADRLTRPSPEVQREAARFLESHRWLGRLVRPDDLARAVTAADREVATLEIVVFRPVLSLRTDRIEMTTARYAYPR